MRFTFPEVCRVGMAVNKQITRWLWCVKCTAKDIIENAKWVLFVLSNTVAREEFRGMVKNFVVNGLPHPHNLTVPLWFWLTS